MIGSQSETSNSILRKANAAKEGINVTVSACNKGACNKSAAIFPGRGQVEPFMSCKRKGCLLKLLQSAAYVQEDGRPLVIIVGVNMAWKLMLELFLQRLAMGRNTTWVPSHLILVNFDHSSFSHCTSLRPRLHCFLSLQGNKSKENEFATEAFYMTPEYLNLMWYRLTTNLRILELGFDIIFTDNDILWFRNPLPFFGGDFDMYIACDRYKEEESLANGGFYFVRSNERTLKFFRYWISSHQRFPGFHDQGVLNEILPLYDAHSKMDIGLRLKLLPPAHFGGLCEQPDVYAEMVTMHTNCCAYYEAKLATLNKVASEWDAAMAAFASNGTALAIPQPWGCG
eukprot:TRINITY_DN5144_c0_g1_i1.p1 TRINITY_DN5144_c0_g1~~TRINITY_DN5144_c0_g1_i1.p1  ORF type:complete len:400 (-),score=86.39 TRINITY_DN5144_c0_g1_i1:192-1214(-)